MYETPWGTMIHKKTVSKEHIHAAVEGYLKALGMIDDDTTVTNVTGSGTHFTVITEKEK
jgi:hypothetical protein